MHTIDVYKRQVIVGRTYAVVEVDGVGFQLHRTDVGVGEELENNVLGDSGIAPVAVVAGDGDVVAGGPGNEFIRTGADPVSYTHLTGSFQGQTRFDMLPL